MISEKTIDCVLLADRRHGLTEGVRRAALETGADAFVQKREIATDLLPAVERVCARRATE